MSWFDSIVDTSTKAFNWLEENPTAASFIGGAAVGLLQYKTAKDEREYQRQLRDEERAYQEKFGGASTTEAGKTAPTNLLGGQGSLTSGGEGSLTGGNITSMAGAFNK